MFEPFLGDIFPWSAPWTPRGFMPCDGRLLTVRDNVALFSLLGTRYGGNGSTNFALPDLRGRVPVGVGTGAGLSPVAVGEQLGSAEADLVAVNGGQVAGTAAEGPVAGTANSNFSPSLGVNYIIAATGRFPSRS